MKTNSLTGACVALVVSAAAAAVLISQGAFAQGEGADSGFAALIGRDRIRTDDPRFQPAAELVVHEASNPSAKGTSAISRYILIDMHSRRVVYWPATLGRAAEQPRKLTASEAVFLEELFSHNLSKLRDAEINRNGFEGTIKPQDIDIKPADLVAKAKVRAAAKSKWYTEGAQGLGPS